MQTFDFLFGVILGELLRHSDNLSMTLQSSKMSAAKAQQIVSMTVKTLETLRMEDNFGYFWITVTKTADELSASEPGLLRKRRVPQRFETANASAEFHPTVEQHYRQMYYEALDLIITCIRERFDQPGYRVYSKLQDLLLKCVNGKGYSEEFDFLTDFYEDDFSPE